MGKHLIVLDRSLFDEEVGKEIEDWLNDSFEPNGPKLYKVVFGDFDNADFSMVKSIVI